MTDELLEHEEHPDRPLSDKARQFAEELGWSDDFNGTAAARRVGYKGKWVRKIAHQLRRDPRVKAIVDAILIERAGETRVKAALALEELAIVMKSDLSHFAIDDRGMVRVKASAPPGAMRAVASIKRKRREIPRKDQDPIVEYDTEFRLYDKNPAITNALKHLGLLKDVIEHHDGTLEALIRDAQQQATTAEGGDGDGSDRA